MNWVVFSFIRTAVQRTRVFFNLFCYLHPLKVIWSSDVLVSNSSLLLRSQGWRVCQPWQIKAWLKSEIFSTLAYQVLTGTNDGEHFFHVSQQCSQKKNRKTERLSCGGKTLVTASNMFLMVVHSKQRGRQMPLVKRSYLFCPWKRLKNNKSILNKG